MALLVLCDGEYRHGVWCDTKIRGIEDEASRRRIKLKIFNKISEVKNVIEKSIEDVSVILLFDSLPWLENVINELSDSGAHFILSANYVIKPLPVEYSLVGTDADSAMRDTVSYLHQCGKNRIALVGVNKNSCNDTCRAHMFEKYVKKENGSIFYIKDNVLSSFGQFFSIQEEFDAAICTNDLITICLAEYLKNYERKNSKLFVISHTDTVMARLYGDGITSVTTNFYECGRMLVETYFNRIKYGFASSKNLIPSELKIRGSTDNIPFNSKDLLKPCIEFAVDPLETIYIHTGDIGRLERLLATSDIVNLKLMYCLICGYNYEKMSEYCFISPETARYRVRKIKSSLGVSKKSGGAELIRKYIKKESLLKIISEAEERNSRFLI